ncbi:MAG: VOC family protein [Dehalococcoidia bacterium]
MAYEFDHVHIKAPDPKTTADWYVRAFNFRIVDDQVRPSGARFIRCRSVNDVPVNISGANTGEHLEPGDANARCGIEHILVRVNELDAAVKHLTALGGTLLEGPIGGNGDPLIAFVKGPDDTRMEFGQAATAQPVDYHVGHVHLKGLDPKKTADWYVNAFQFKIVRDYVRNFGDRFIQCETTDGFPVNISGPRPNEHLDTGNANAHWGLEHFGLNIADDIEVEIKRLEDMGASLLEGPIGSPGELRIAFIKGPDDTRIEILQRPV